MRSPYIEITEHERGYHDGQAAAFRLMAEFLRKGHCPLPELLDKWEADAAAQSEAARKLIRDHVEALNEQSRSA